MVEYTGSPNSPEYGTAILDELRRVMKDTSYESPQFELQALGVPGALVEVTDEHLITTVAGPVGAEEGTPTAESLDIDLSAGSECDTIEKLVNFLQSQGGYQANMVEDCDPNHSSSDLRMMPPTEISTKAFIFKTRRWADSELSSAVDRAVGRHNLELGQDPFLNYGGPHTAETIPKDHEYFIILLAQIELMKVLIHDGMKRRGTDLTAPDYDLIKRSLEDEYNAALTRYLAASKGAGAAGASDEALEDLGSGDIIVGHSYRETLHSPAQQQWVRSAVAPGPVAVQLMATLLPLAQVLLQWSPSRGYSFWKYEIWRNTNPSVSNISDYVRPAGAIPPQGVKIRTETQQETYQWVDGVTTPLVPGLTYYYRIYVFDRNGKVAEGPVVKAPIPGVNPLLPITRRVS